MFVVFFFHSKNNVFGLNFHHLLIFSKNNLQVCVSTSVCFAKCVLILPSVTSFVCCQSHFSNLFLFLHNGYCYSEEVRLIIVVDELDFRIEDVAFKVKVCSINVAPLIKLRIRAWKI
jgi:hypothetical protein